MRNIIIKDGRNHRVISGNAISLLDTLPASILELDYGQETGFNLNETDSPFKNSEKLYGDAEAITERVLSAFDIVEGNLGVLFSGPKGLGKSLTVRNICKGALKRGLPVILVKKHFEDITAFVETINQSVAVVFDEFEKIYLDRNKADRDDLEGQDSLLNLFDSSLKCKKLFLLTINDTHNLSDYLLNRPGRLHYHFRMNRLSIEEITEYCKDRLDRERHELIRDILSLGARIPDFSYDMLRSIVFELNTRGCGLPEARKVLNIEAKARSPFDYTVYFKSGKTENGFDYIDTGDSRHGLNWYGKAGGERDGAAANMLEARWTGDTDGSLSLDGKYVHWTQRDKKCTDRVEKIVFVPAKGGFLASENDWD